MRVQYTNKETEIIEGKSYDAYIPFNFDGLVITAGLRITDVYKFNMFISQYLQDEDIRNQIGAELVHVDLHEPITRDKLINIHNFLGSLIYDEAAIEAEKQAQAGKEETSTPENEYPEDDSDEDYGEE